MTSRLITANELLHAPTGLDWNTIAEGAGDSSDSVAQAIEQSHLLDSASAWVNNKLDMPLGVHAASQTEQAVLRRSASQGAQVWVDREGALNFRTATLPVVSVSQLQYGTLPMPVSWNQLTTANLLIVGNYPQVARIQDWSVIWASYLGGQTLVQITYTSGWPNAVLTASATSGSSKTLTVDSTAGMQTTALATGQDNSRLTIFSQDTEEVVTVTNVVDATHVTVASLANNHSAGERMSNMPGDIRQAVIFAAMWLARERGTDALIMGGTSTNVSSDKVTGDVMKEATKLLKPYMRRI